jgi:ribosomal protein S18 acetylase RimI-like enzyme
MDLVFRPADSGDARAMMPLVYSSGPEFFDYVFAYRTGVSSRVFLDAALLQAGGELGYGAHHVAMLDGRVVAAGAAYGGADARRFTRHALWHIPKRFGLVRGAGVIRRGLQIERLCVPPRGDLHYIGHVGVAPDLRGRGIGGALMEYLMDAGRAAGRKRTALDVAVTNPGAEALYARMGFEVVGERMSGIRFEGRSVPSMRRMERRL